VALLSACSAGTPPGPASSPVPTPSAGVSVPSTTASASPLTTALPSEPVEPTTTNTLPPPPDPTGPDPSTAGNLDADELPRPGGWRTVEAEGGEEEGYQGNGTWVHARDARYAAQAVITIGCADITRDDYPDPTLALEGTYENADGAPGIGLVLQFGDADTAGRYWSRYGEQVRACTTVQEPVHTELVDLGPAARGETLMDRRTYPDGEWTEVGVRRGDRVTLLVLSDEGHAISRAQAGRIIDQVP